MMSIEEFATEYAQDKYLPFQTSQAVKAGANYVLECIEESIKNAPAGYGLIYNIGYGLIYHIIEQLKK